MLEQFALGRVDMVEVELERHHVGGRLLERVEAVATRLLAIEQHRLVGRRGDVLVHHVDFALQRLEQEHFGVGDHLVDDAVEIRQLRPVGIHLVVEEVAHRDRGFGVLAQGAGALAGEHPGGQRRALGILEVGVGVEIAHFALEQRDPALETFGLGEGVGFRIVLDVELLEVVLGAAHQLVLVGPGHLLQEEAVRGGEHHLEGLLVDHFELGQLTARRPPDVAALVGFGIGEIGVVPELHVGGGERLAVRPLRGPYAA